jgi:pyrroloquinoline quinone biosynthesis protein D
VISLDARPKLAPKARLRLDKLTGRSLLVYPERGLALNDTGAEILALCTGERAVREIIALLVERHGANESLASEVRAFLDSLAERNLLRGLEP